VEGFAQLMNDKARVLGLTGTHFENPNGLDSPAHYSTAADLATLTAYAMKNPIFAKTVSAKNVTLGARSLRNHNKLLWRLEGADGVKTGYTRAAGRILVSSTMRQGRRLVAVTINAGDDWNDHIGLHEQGFSDYTVQTLVQKGQCLGSVAIIGGTAENVDVLAAEDFSFAVSPEEKPYIVLSTPRFSFAPVVQGQRAGTAYICIGDRTVGKVSIVYEQTVEQTPAKKKGFLSDWFGG
jgi:D-alanyl-D-alanine carboxypeptidase